MMKKTKIKKFTVSALLGVLLCFGCVFGMVGLSHTAKADGVNQTKTWEIDTSFRTRVTTELSKATDFKGGTIEFDLLSSDLKDEYNISGICSSLGNWQVGVQYYDFASANLYAERRLNYASINFNFHKTNVDMDDFSWRIGGQKDANGANENQLSSFSYYADGRIVEYASDAGNSDKRTQRVIDPSTAGFVGTQEDIDFFMTPGYSYRIAWIWGTVRADRSVRIFSPEEMNGLAAAERHGWYVVYTKPISAPESNYNVLFAFCTRAVHRLPEAIAVNTLGTYAGFEISSNHGSPRQYSDTDFSEASHNVKMELDNVAIYEGYDYSSSEKKAKTDFEGSYLDLTALSDIETNNSGRTASDKGSYGGNFASGFWKTRNTTVDGLRVQITNAGKQCVEAYAASELKCRTVHTVTFTDGENTLITQNVIDGFAATLPDNRIGDKFYRWNTDGINLNNITQDIEVVGTATDKRYITFDANGGSGSVAQIEGTVGSAVTLSDGTGLSLPTYRMVGWSTEKNGNAEYALSGEYTVTDDDVTLYAVWELMSYKAEFRMPDNTLLEETEVVHSHNAFYKGNVPAHDGKIFTGWNTTVNGVTQETTFVAVFADNYDEFADNKAVNVTYSATVTKAETLSFYRKLNLNEGVKIRLDIISISGFVKAETVLGSVKIEISDFIRDYTTVCIETNAWSYNVSTKALDQSDDEFTVVGKGNVLTVADEGNYGVNFTTADSGTPALSLNELSIREKTDNQRDAMQWGTSISVDAESETIVGGLTAVRSTAAVTLDTVDKTREFTVEFKDKASGNVLATRCCYSGGTATAPKVKGYTYDFVSENNVTESKTVSGTGTKNSYTATFSADGFTFDEKSFGYGDKVVLPTAEDKDVSYKIIVGWSETQDAAEYTYKAGEEIVFNADKNVLLYPVWGLKTYTVTYLGENGETLFTEKVPHGSTATYGGEIPQKEGYVFDGWDPYPTSVTKDVAVKVVFKSLASDKFRVIIADGTGSGSYAAGETVTISADEKNGFTFAEWSTDSNIEITYKDGVYSFVMPDKDVSIMATYKENTTFASLIRNVFIWVTLALFVVAAGAFTFIFVKKRKNK